MNLIIDHEGLRYTVEVDPSSYYSGRPATQFEPEEYSSIDYDIESITSIYDSGFSIEDIVQGDIEFTDIVIAAYKDIINDPS